MFRSKLACGGLPTAKMDRVGGVAVIVNLEVEAIDHTVEAVEYCAPGMVPPFVT
jgi:hypothetical protein